MASQEEIKKREELDAKYLLEKLKYTIIPYGLYHCQSCNKDKSLKEGNYYQTNNPFYDGTKTTYERQSKDGLITVTSCILPYCKSCIEKSFNSYLIDAKNNEKIAMYKLSQDLRIVWNESLYEMANSSKSATWKIYIGKANSLPQYSSKLISDSDSYVGNLDSTFSDEKELTIGTMKKKEKKEAIARWGLRWDEFELKRLEEFYHSMKAVNNIDTPQDEDYLRKLARLSVKIDDAIESDNSSGAKQLGDLYSKYMSDSKFRAMDMTDADKKGGIRTFSQIYEEVERPDFIPPWEKYADKFNIKQDIVDKVIMYLINFTLKFKNSEKLVEPPKDTPKTKEGVDNGNME